jgi:hypothetical protein
MYYELSKSQKKIARMVMDEGLENHYMRGLYDAEAIPGKWRNGKFASAKEAYMKLFQCVKKNDNNIAGIYNNKGGSRRVAVMADQLTEIVASSPAIKICLLIINAIRAENGLKLTTGGKLPRKIVNEIYNLNIYAEINRTHTYKKVLNELDYLPAAFSNALMKLSCLVIVRKNKLQLTKTGKKVAEYPVLLFQTLFTTFATNFNKGYLDRYESNSIGNLGMLYTVYLLSLFGKKQREASFYAQLYLKAFPVLINEIKFHPFSTPEESAYDCFIYRTFNKGLLLFGLVEIEYEGKDYLDRKIYIKTSEIFHHVFKIA